MRSIPAPAENPEEVYLSCINSISNASLRSRLSILSGNVAAGAAKYWINGIAHQLYTLTPSDCKNEDIVIGLATKKELKDVYSVHMVGRTKPARRTYDLLLSRAPLGRCPFCGIGHASTLDHYLPKTKYPLLSVVPLNLVPSCKDCNTGKNAAISTTAETQNLHPYFDNQFVVNEQWIYAEIVSTSPENVRFFVRPPEHWDNVLKKRVRFHFESFKLAERFAIEAANELANQEYLLSEIRRKSGVNSLVEFLSDQADSNFRKHANSWQTAFYQAFVFKVSKELSGQKADKEYCRKLETCPRCSGLGKILDSSCDACSGVGAALKEHFDHLGESVYAPVACPKCIAGSLDCSSCKGMGSILWQKAKDFSSR